MRLRSMLLVSADQPEAMAAALEPAADAVAFDLSSSFGNGESRRAVADLLGRNPSRSTWVCIHELDDPEIDRDLAAIVAARPDGIILPGAEGGASVAELARRLTERGNVSAMILPSAAGSGASMFQLGTYAGVKRLAGISWGVERLTESIGASTWYEDGAFTAPFEIARSLCLFGASAAGVPAIETPYPDPEDLDGLREFATRASRDGFSGMLAIDPGQVPVINEAFSG